MRIDLFSNSGSYQGYKYYFDAETKKYYEEEYIWHHDDGQEVVGTYEVSAEVVLNRLKETSHMYGLARLEKYCNIDTADYIMKMIKDGEEKRKKYWENKAVDIGLFKIKRTKALDRQHIPGEFRRVYNKTEKYFELEFLICNAPYTLLSVVFDEKGYFSHYKLIWYIRKKERIIFDIETETKYLLFIRASDLWGFRITNKLIDALNRPVSETAKEIKDIQALFSNLTQKTYMDLLMR